MSANIHISLSAEPIAHFGSFPFTNAMLTSLLVSAGIVIFALIANRSLKSTARPSGIQNFAEFVVESFFNLCYSITGDMRKAQAFLPWIGTFFLFIMLNNWSGLLPGVGYISAPVSEPPAAEHALILAPQAVASEPTEQLNELAVTEPGTVHVGNESVSAVSEEAHDALSDEEAGAKLAGEITESHGPANTPIFRAGTADLNTTIALGLITVFMIQYFGFKFQGPAYATKYFNFTSPINFFVGILELISEFGKIISFAFRLFGNVFAGEVLIAVLMYLTKVVVPIPFYGLEVFVGMMQAVVFSMLSLVLYNMATISHHEEH